MTRVGITGHRDLRHVTHRLVRAAVAAELTAYRPLHGISSLAEGADQIFAEQVLEARGALTAVIPSAGYAATFRTVVGRALYRNLRGRATEVIELPFPGPSEDAYWAAGRQVVCLSDVLLAVWDGAPSGGVGGTADVVAFAGERGIPTTVLWPPGSRRG
jgi:hypothetical protein